MTHSENKKFIKKHDVILISAIIFIAIAFFVAFKYLGKSGKTAVISVDGNVVKSVNLAEKNHGYTLSVVDGIVIEVNNGKIRVRSSDCPDKICVNTGYISKTDEKIVCLPKKLIIEITVE